MYYKIADCFVKYEPNYMYMQKKIKPYEIEVKKYISKIKLNNNGKEIEYE